LFIQGFISNHFSTSNQKNNGWEQNWIIIYFLLMASNFCFTRKESIYQRWKEAKAFVDFKQAYFVKGIYLNILSTNPNSKVPINMQQITDNELLQMIKILIILSILTEIQFLVHTYRKYSIGWEEPNIIVKKKCNKLIVYCQRKIDFSAPYHSFYSSLLW
jgi:hypothetical protein